MGYVKKTWVNKPNTTTPILANDLNHMEQGIYDATYENGLNVSNEVDEDYRVNFLKSRNMIDSLSLVAGDYSGQVPTTRVSTRQQIYLKAGTYTFSTNLNTSTYRYYINTLEGTPPNLVQKYNSGWQTGSSFTFTITNANEGYFVLVIGRVDSGTLSVSDVSSNQFMLNEGSTATTYEEFIQNQIVVDNEKYTDTLNVGASLDSRSRVNVLKSKNLLDLQYLQLLTNSSGTVIVNNGYWDVIIDTRNINSLYVSGNFSLLADNVIRVGTYSSYPVLGSTGTRLTLQANGTINTSNVNYVLFAFGVSSSSVTMEQVKASFMINEGNTALPYEPYVVPSIYVDNEEIYNAENKDAISNLMAQLRFVGRYYTGNSLTFYFTDIDVAKKCYIIVVTKESGDGDFSGIWFIRTSASGVGKIVQTGSGQVNMTASLNGNAITCTFSGDAKYCIVNVYQILNQ